MNSPFLHLSPKSWSVILLPALLSLGLIWCYSVDVPKEDAWITPGTIIENVIEGNVSIKDVFSQHLQTESREAFPRLIFLAVAFTVGWHATIFMVLSWLCVVGTFLILLKMLPSRTKQHSAMFHYLALLMGAILFSPAQWENQLWGIQLILFIPALCLVTCLWLQRTQVSFGPKVIGCAVLSLISTFSYPHGMACWLLGAPFFRSWLIEIKEPFHKGKTKMAWWITLYLGLALCTMGFYFYDFVNEISYSFFFTHPVEAVAFFAALVGAPFAKFYNIPLFVVSCVGLGLIGVVTISIVVILQQWIRSHNITFAISCYPWICLLAFGLLSSLAVASGRGEDILEFAHYSSYTTVSLWVTLGLLGIVGALWNFDGLKTFPATKMTFRLFLAILSLLTVFSWVDGAGQMQNENLHGRHRLLNLRLLPVAPSNSFFSINQPWLSSQLIRKRFMLFSQHGILPIRPIGPWIAEKIQKPDSGAAGWYMTRELAGLDLTSEACIRGVHPCSKALRVEGWAKLPHRGVPPDFVLLAQRNHAGKLDVVTGFLPHIQRPDIVMAENNPQLLHSGFIGSLDSSYLENPQFLLFAVDLKEQRVYELKENLT